MSSLYFDHNATTPLDPRVLEEMLPFFIDRHGNPSSAHSAGRAARVAVENARAQVAELANIYPTLSRVRDVRDAVALLEDQIGHERDRLQWI